MYIPWFWLAVAIVAIASLGYNNGYEAGRQDERRDNE